MSETAVGPSSSFRPTVFHVALLIPWVALVVTAFRRVSDNSFLWHIRAGELQVETGSVLTSDPFSFTVTGEPWRTQSWLAELGYAWFEASTGITFTGWLVLVFSLLTVFGLGLVASRYSRGVPATAVVLLLTAVLLPRFLVPRPVLFSYLLFVLVVLAWDRHSTRWSLPFLFWLWASVHVSFLVGLGYMGLRAIQAREWVAWRVILVSGAVTLMTAHGLGVLEIMWSFLTARPYLALISEWQTPNLLQIDLLPIVAAIVLIVYGATRDRIAPDSLWIFAPFLAFTLSAERAVAMGWIALVPILALSLRDMRAGWVRGFGRTIAIGIVLLVAVLPVIFIEAVELDEESLPVAAAEELEDLRTFHDDYAGGYLIWLAGPEREVYLDDRAELYRERVKESVEVRAARTDWRDVFERDGIEQVMLKESDALLSLLAVEGWETVHRDDRYVVMRP